MAMRVQMKMEPARPQAPVLRWTRPMVTLEIGKIWIYISSRKNAIGGNPTTPSASVIIGNVHVLLTFHTLSFASFQLYILLRLSKCSYADPNHGELQTLETTYNFATN